MKLLFCKGKFYQKSFEIFVNGEEKNNENCSNLGKNIPPPGITPKSSIISIFKSNIISERLEKEKEN